MGTGPRSRTALLLLQLVALALLAQGCAVNPVTGKRELQLVRFTPEEEVRLGAQAYGPAVQEQGGFYRDPALERYVQEVGMRVARVSQRPDLDYRFRVLNSSVPNAFALPGGFIVINRGLLVGLRNEAEMAAVLAHETGHVTARHSLAAYQRAMAANLLLAGIAVGTGGKQGVMQLSAITTNLLQNGFSREQERESDNLGLDYMVKAGYNPEGAIQLQEYFYSELEGKKNPLFIEGIFRTHPFSKDRLEAARREIAAKYPDTLKNPRYTLQEAEYRQKTARLREVQKAYDLYDEGEKLFARKNYAGAMEKYRAAAAREPDQAPFHSAIGRAFLAQNNVAAAQDALQKAIRLDDQLFEPQFLLGATRYKQKDYRQAIPALEKSMDLLPSKEAAGLLAQSYRAIGDTANAQKYEEMTKQQ